MRMERKEGYEREREKGLRERFGKPGVCRGKISDKKEGRNYF